MATPVSLFIWTDMPAEHEEGFDRWYAQEHMPDRVLHIAGFTRGRRYRALSGGPRYLAHYEMAHPDVLVDPDYIKIRSNPDPKSAYYIARFQNACRSSSTAKREFGAGGGTYFGIVATRQGALADYAAVTLLGPPLEAIAGRAGFGMARLLRTDPGTIERSAGLMSSHVRSRLRAPDRIPEWIATVQGEDAAAVEAAVADLRRLLGEDKVEAWAVMQITLDIAPGPGERTPPPVRTAGP